MCFLRCLSEESSVGNIFSLLNMGSDAGGQQFSKTSEIQNKSELSSDWGVWSRGAKDIFLSVIPV